MLAERALNKPYYFLRPRQAVRRVWRRAAAPTGGPVAASLAWGGEMDVFPSDVVGSSIWRTGVFELVVSETLARLLDPGELAIDVGANVGYMTCLMASRVSESGQVVAFEPHPELSRVLRSNAEQPVRKGRVTVVEAALSDRAGSGQLVTGSQFQHNMGTATLATTGSPRTEDALPVRLERLDDVLADRNAGLVKVDVEGHELEVLRGARRALAQRRIRDIVFEENEALPTAVTRLLKAAGYLIFGLDQRVLGPRLVAPQSSRARPLWEAPTYLATLDPERARRRMRPRGWRVLRPASE